MTKEFVKNLNELTNTMDEIRSLLVQLKDLVAEREAIRNSNNT